MKLSPAECTLSRDSVRLQAEIVSNAGSEFLWFEFDARLAPSLVVDRLDAFAVIALIMAMERGEDLIVDGAISERLLHNLDHQVRPILRLVIPELHDSRIHAQTVDSRGEPRGRGVATGFSGGIDSFSTIAEYFSPDTAPGYKLTHLLFCDVGSHPSAQIRDGRWSLIKEFGQAIGLELVTVRSNLMQRVKTRFERTHMLRNAAAALTLQGLFGKYLYSSGYRFQECHFHEYGDIACADPAMVHQFSTESFEAISTGCQHSRVDKTRLAVSVPHVRRFLNVCNHPDATARNCSKCYKCLRTLVTLELLGQIDGFDQVFDLDVYRHYRTEYLLLMPGRTEDALIGEIFEFSKHAEAHLPWYAAAIHAMWPALKLPYAAARSIKRFTKRVSK